MYNKINKINKWRDVEFQFKTRGFYLYFSIMVDSYRYFKQKVDKTMLFNNNTIINAGISNSNS